MRNELFWKKAARSLPEPYRSRYAGYFARSERWEHAFEELAALAASIVRRPTSRR